MANRNPRDALAWIPEERGNLTTEYFDPIIIPTIEDVSWAEKNLPIPPGNYDHIIDLVKGKLKIGVYEPSNSSYCSRWFCVDKKGGKELRIVCMTYNP